MPLLDDINFSAPACAGCQFWLPDEDTPKGVDPVVGYCRRKSPMPFSDTRVSGAIWPYTQCDDWCGEYSVMPVAP